MTTEQRPGPSKRFQQKKELMLSGATTLFNQQGLKGGTLADVAEFAALSLKSVRYYFTRKEDLVNECFQRSFDAYDALIDQAAAGDRPTERVRLLIDAWMVLYARIRRGEHPPILNFGHVTAVDDDPEHPVRKAYGRMFARMEQLMAPGGRKRLPAGLLAARTHFVLSQLLWAVVWIGRYEADHLARVGEHLQRILTTGLLAEGEAWAPREVAITPLGEGLDPSRESFLRAATTLINRHGYRGASVDKIAAELGMTKGAFYHHHDAKDGLVEDCFIRTFDVMRTVQQASEQVSPRASVRLASMGVCLMRYQLGPDGPLLRTSALAALPLSIKEDMKLRMDAITQRFYDMLMDGVLEGSVRPVDAWIAAQMLNGVINSAAELRLWVPGIPVDTAIAAYLQPLFSGFFQAA